MPRIHDPATTLHLLYQLSYEVSCELITCGFKLCPEDNFLSHGLSGLALNYRKTMVLRKLFNHRALQKGCMGGSMKYLFQWESDTTSTRRRMRN